MPRLRQRDYRSAASASCAVGGRFCGGGSPSRSSDTSRAASAPAPSAGSDPPGRGKPAHGRGHSIASPQVAIPSRGVAWRGRILFLVTCPRRIDLLLVTSCAAPREACSDRHGQPLDPLLSIDHRHQDVQCPRSIPTCFAPGGTELLPRQSRLVLVHDRHQRAEIADIVCGRSAVPRECFGTTAASTSGSSASKTSVSPRCRGVDRHLDRCGGRREAQPGMASNPYSPTYTASMRPPAVSGTSKSTAKGVSSPDGAG